MIGYNTARAYLEAKQTCADAEVAMPELSEQTQAELLEKLTYARMALLDEMLVQVATDVITGPGFHGRVIVAKGRQ